METIDRCLQSLRTSTSDSEKLAALMVLSKVCDTISKDEDVTVQLFEAISPTFLSRLLKSSVTANNSFKVIGINILSFFARTNPAILLKDEEGKQLINQMLDIFTPSKKSENSTLYMDSLNIFLSLANLDTGATYLLQKNVFTQFFGYVILEEDLVEKVISIFQSLLYHHGGLHEDYMKYLNNISNSFMSDQELLKFQYLKIITKLFQIVINCKLQINYVEDGFVSVLKNISMGCKDIMQSRVKAGVKRTIIVLLCNLMKICGRGWIFDQQCVESVSNFILLLSTVVSVELTFLFHSKITEDELNDQRSVVSGLFIAQSVLDFICSDSFECHALVADNSFISHIFSTLKSIMSCVYDFLSSFDQNNVCLQNPILVSAISMLSRWATEETENLREELIKVLPFLMKVGKNDLENVMQNNQTSTVLDIMAPCISQIIPENKMRTILVSDGCHDLYVQYLTYSLTVESHNTKPEHLESLFHMMHQFTILEPNLCNENSKFKDLFMKLLKFIINLPTAYHLNSYSCLEMIIVTLTFVRMYKMEYSNSLEHVMKVSIEIVYKLTGESFDDNNIEEIWFIAIQNIIECFRMYKVLVKSIKNASYLKGWSSKVSITKDMKKNIDELFSLMGIS